MIGANRGAQNAADTARENQGSCCSRSPPTRRPADSGSRLSPTDSGSRLSPADSGSRLSPTDSGSRLSPATDLGFLLHKHPGRVQSFELSVGTAHVFYPAVADDVCTVALLLEVDPVGLVRAKGPKADFALAQYVNDRPYAASSMLALALKGVLGPALTGRCDARPELAAGTLPLQIRIPALSCRGGIDLAQRFFEPLVGR